MHHAADPKRLQEALLLEAYQVVPGRLPNHAVNAGVGLIGEVGIRVAKGIAHDGELAMVQIRPAKELLGLAQLVHLGSKVRMHLVDRTNDDPKLEAEEVGGVEVVVLREEE